MIVRPALTRRAAWLAMREAPWLDEAASLARDPGDAPIAFAGAERLSFFFRRTPA